MIDERHHTPALQLSSVVSTLPAHFVLGLSATPYRRDGLDPVIGFFLGPITATLDKKYLLDRLLTPTITCYQTHLPYEGDSFGELVSQLVADHDRNALLVSHVLGAARQGRKVLVLTERVDRVDPLARLIRARGCDAAVSHGGRYRAEREEVRGV